jgi:hypothetical protein
MFVNNNSFFKLINRPTINHNYLCNLLSFLLDQYNFFLTYLTTIIIFFIYVKIFYDFLKLIIT